MNKIKIKKWDYLLIISAVMSPMNYLRIWKIGPSELMCLIWSINQIYRFRYIKRDNILYKFWIIFLFSITMGTIYSLIFNIDGLRIQDIFTYLYLAFISISIYIKFITKEKQYIIKIFKKICEYSTIWYLLLYIYSRVISYRIIGIMLWYGNGYRFSGGADNPHQLAILLGAVLFGNLYFMFDKKLGFKYRIKFLILLLISFFISMETKSSTFIVAISITFLIAIYNFLLQNINNNSHKIILKLMPILILLIFFVYYDFFISIISSYIESDVNGLRRLEIFKSAKDAISKNVFFGIGPGVHGYNELEGNIELHNTYLEIIAMSGLLGFSAFLKLTFKMFGRFKKNYILLLPIIFLYSYGLAGFAMRRLIYWIVTTILLTIVSKDTGVKNEKEYI